MVRRFFRSAVIVACIVAAILLIAAILAASQMEGSISLPLSVLIVQCALLVWNKAHGRLAALGKVTPKR